MPRVQLVATADIESAGQPLRVRVKLQNPSAHLAFQVRLGIREDGAAMEILPVLWDDNYVELLPGESREFTAQYLSPDAMKGNPELTVAGWNIEPLIVPLRTRESE